MEKLDSLINSFRINSDVKKILCEMASDFDREQCELYRILLTRAAKAYKKMKGGVSGSSK